MHEGWLGLFLYAIGIEPCTFKLVNDALDISCITSSSYLEGTWYLQEDAWCFDSFLLWGKNHGSVGQMPKPVNWNEEIIGCKTQLVFWNWDQS